MDVSLPAARAADRSTDLAAALRAFDAAILLAPRRAELHLNRAVLLGNLGRAIEASQGLRRALALDPGLAAAHVEIGKLALVAMRIEPAIAAFEAALAVDPQAIGAHLGLYEALQVCGQRDRAVAHQRLALAQRRLFFERTAAAGAPTMLILATPGDWQANTPLEYLYSHMPLGVTKLYLDGALPQPRDVPAADVVFNAIAHSDAAETALRSAAAWLPHLGLPVINDPERVLKLSRDGVARDYAGLEGALVPQVRRVARKALASDRLVSGASSAAPVMLRPIDSQAGNDFVRLENPDALDAYLCGLTAAEFFVAPFVDYRSADGFYRKYRVIFVEGVPYSYHLAISDRWMVHYYNARNAEFDWIRAEEANWLADIEFAFDGPRAKVLRDLAAGVGLDYFGIDCGILPDGRVVLFEIDVAMIVHLGDPVEKYPYKHQYVPRIFSAVESMIRARARIAK